MVYNQSIMSEIYRDSINVGIEFDIPSVIPSSAKFYRWDDEYVATLNGSIALVPYPITRVDGKFRLEWTYTVDGASYTKVEYHDVVTPVFREADLVAWDSDFSRLGTPAIFRLEAIIRRVIQEVTGQKFNYEYDRIEVTANNRGVISMPKRLVEATGLNDVSASLVDSIVLRKNDGWTITATRGESWIDHFEGPIRLPGQTFGHFVMGVNYVISGYWGYPSLPEDIAIAARILAEDYGCDESLWRDRYIANIRAADWRFEFNKKAFVSTGNVKADQILEKYTLNRMVVV